MRLVLSKKFVFNNYEKYVVLWFGNFWSKIFFLQIPGYGC